MLDPWHTITNFMKHVNKSFLLHSQIHRELSAVLYVFVTDRATRKEVKEHVPKVLIALRIDAIVSKYSKPIDGIAGLSSDFHDNWRRVKADSTKHSMLSNRAGTLPSSARDHIPTMSTSPLEPFHRWLNRLFRSAIKCSEGLMTALLADFFHRWNLIQLRKAGRLRALHSFDGRLIDTACQSDARLYEREQSQVIWGGRDLPLLP